MNPIIKAVSEIKYRIPPQILNQVFQKKSYRYRDAPIAIDEQIINQVIRPRVMVNCDLVGGVQVRIPLLGLEGQYTDEFTVVYRIPKSLTQNRSITSVLSMTYVNGAAAAYMSSNAQFQPCSVTPPLMAGQAMMDAMSPMPVPSTARVTLVGENTVAIRELTGAIGSGELLCLIGNEENMANLQLRSTLQFCEMCVLAVKAYIYNDFIITIDQGQLNGGVVLGMFKQIVENWADAEQMYQDYLFQKWQGIAFMNDREGWERHIKMMVGGPR